MPLNIIQTQLFEANEMTNTKAQVPSSLPGRVKVRVQHHFRTEWVFYFSPSFYALVNHDVIMGIMNGEKSEYLNKNGENFNYMIRSLLITHAFNLSPESNAHSCHQRPTPNKKKTQSLSQQPYPPNHLPPPSIVPIHRRIRPIIRHRRQPIHHGAIPHHPKVYRRAPHLHAHRLAEPLSRRHRPPLAGLEPAAQEDTREVRRRGRFA